MTRARDDLLARIRGEIDDRLWELRPAVAEYQRLLQEARSAGLELADPGSPPRRAARRRTAPPAPRAPRDAVASAIVAALEHGSHTSGELVVVTAMSPATVRQSLRRLCDAGTERKGRREGSPVYVLASTSR